MAFHLPAFACALTLAATGCVESGTYDKAAAQLEDARRAVLQKDVQLRAYDWQVQTLAQQLREGQQRSDALARELIAQAQHLTAVNSALAEKVTHLELERADMLQAESRRAAEPPGPRGVRPDEVRRLIAATDARNAQIVEELARIERALASGNNGGASPPRPRPTAGRGRPLGLRLAQVMGFASPRVPR